jgi:hypothetical protein
MAFFSAATLDALDGFHHRWRCELAGRYISCSRDLNDSMFWLARQSKTFYDIWGQKIGNRGRPLLPPVSLFLGQSMRFGIANSKTASLSYCIDL